MRTSIKFLILAGILTAAVGMPRSARSGDAATTHLAHEMMPDIADSAATAHGSHWPIILAGLYCVAVVLASLGGGWLPLAVRLTHTRLQISMSFCGGLMLGIGLLHMLPHSFAVLGSLDQAVGWLTIGLLTMFFLIRAFHFHQHEPAELQHAVHDHGDHDHDHPHGHHRAQHHHPAERLNWIGVVLGLGLHTLFDGIALAASVEADAVHGGGGLLGLGTFLAILLHKPLDTVPISILMRADRTSSRLRHIINGAFAALCPVGVALFFLGFGRFAEHQADIVGCALAFSAGIFLCISLSDLLPELEFHAHDRFKLSFALVLGVMLAYAIGFLEPEHAHAPHSPAVHAHDEDH